MVKSIGVCAVFFIIILSQYNLLCQEKIKADIEFFNNWLREDYYDGLQKHKTPAELFNLIDGIMAVRFNKKTNLLTWNSNFHEGGEFGFSVFSKKKLKITCVKDTSAIYLAQLLKEDGQTKLLLNNVIKKIKYIKLPQKYSNPFSEEALINDLFFTGSYFINGDKQKKVSFTSKGKVLGWNNFTHYVLNLEGKGAPDYDVIWLQVRKEGKIKKVLPLHWKKNGNKIELFSVSDDSPYAVIKNKYVELIKIK